MELTRIAPESRQLIQAHREGGFTIADTGPYTNADVFYRIELTVEDSQGLTTTVVRDIQPRTSTVTLGTNVPGLTLNLDGQPQAAPYTFVGVEGFRRVLEAPATQAANGTTYEFVSWSDGLARSHEITTPVADTTYTAAPADCISAPNPG